MGMVRRRRYNRGIGDSSALPDRRLDRRNRHETPLTGHWERSGPPAPRAAASSAASPLHSGSPVKYAPPPATIDSASSIAHRPSGVQ